MTQTSDKSGAKLSGRPERRRRRGGQPTDMGLLVARVASARAERPNASIRSLAAQARVGRQAVREAILLLEEAARWAYESESGLRDGPCHVPAFELRVVAPTGFDAGARASHDVVESES